VLGFFATRLAAIEGARAVALLDKHRRVLGESGEWPADVPMRTVRTLAAATVLHGLGPSRGVVVDDIRVQSHIVGEATTLYVALVARRVCVGIVCDGRPDLQREHVLGLALLDLRAHLLDLAGTPAGGSSGPLGGSGNGGGSSGSSELQLVEAGVSPGVLRPKN